MHHERPPAIADPRRRHLTALVALAVLVPLLAVLGPSPAGADPVAVARDAGTFTSTLFPADHAFPDGTGDQRAVVRDCGFSAPLPSGVSLWLFCDSAVYDDIAGSAPDLSATTRFVASATAALSPTATDPSPSQPVQLHEAAYPALPQRFVHSSGRYGPPEDRRDATCPGGGTTYAWTKGMVTLPGTSRVVAWFQDHCPDLASAFAEYDVGVATFDAPALGPDDLGDDVRVTATARHDSVLVNPAPAAGDGWTWGQGPVVHGDHLYVFSSRSARFDCNGTTCSLVTPGLVAVARVTWADGAYTDGSRYEYYAGDGTWSAEETDAVSVLPDVAWPSGDGLSVAWYPQVGRYVMIHANSRFTPTNGASVRTAPTPWGPWTGPVDVGLDASSSYANPDGGCLTPTSCRTFLLHPELTGADDLYLSYVRNDDLATPDGQIVTLDGKGTFRVRLAAVPLSVLPSPPAETAITSAPPAHAPATTAEVAFTSPVRPTDAAGAGGSTAGITFTCALDGAPAEPCTSPHQMTDLAPGTHQVAVTAVSADGVAAPPPAIATFAVDGSAPDTTVVAGPPDRSTPATSTFTFAGTDDQDGGDDLGFACALDGGAFEPCDATWTATSATSGVRTLAVRAIDRAGNVDPTPATWTWDVDEPPVVTITSGPDPFWRWTSATFGFTRSDDRTWTIVLDPECSLDGAPFTPCGSPLSLAGLAEGPHRLEVRTTDGNGSTTTAARDWTVDLAPPAAPTLEPPAARSPLADPTVAFAAVDDRSAPADLTFECSLDYGPWAGCSSPEQLVGLAEGHHRIAVRARDQAGNLGPSTAASWTVDTVAPTVTGTGPSGTTAATEATVVLDGRDDRTWPADVTYECALDGGPATPCPATTTLTDLLPGSHTLEARAVDEAGNRSAPLPFAWTVDYVVTPPPPAATAGQPYEHVLTTNASGRGIDEAWTVTGDLPAGVRLWAGALTGTPTEAGTFGPITVQATSTLGTASTVVWLEVVDTDSVTGTVTNAVTGAPVPGIRVQAFHSTGLVLATATTGADGTFSTGYLRPGEYRLSYVDLDGAHVSTYGTGQATLAQAQAVTVADGVPVVADAAMTPLTTLAGRVTESGTGTPMVGVWVTLYDDHGASAGLRLTDATGRYRFRNLPAGSYRVSFTDMTGAHARQFHAGSSDLAGATPLALGAGGEVVVDAELAAVTAVTGVVTDRASGAPLADIWVNLYDDQDVRVGFRVTDASGAYAFRNLAPGDYRVSFTDVSGTYAPAGTSVLVDAGEVRSDASMSASTTLTGTVVDALSGAPVAGIWVLVNRPDGTMVTFRVTDAAGRWSVPGLTPGPYQVAFTDTTRRHLASSTPVDATAGTVVLDAAVTPSATLRGVVTDSVTGAPVAGARVSLVRGDGSGAGMTFSAVDGSYAFGALPADAYRVSVADPTGAHHATYWPAAADLAGATPIALAAGQTATADVAVDPVTVLTGTLTDATTGAPVPGMWVVLHAPDGTFLLLAATAADGTYRFGALRPGDHRVRFADPAGRYVNQWWPSGTTVGSAAPVVAAGGTVVVDQALTPR